MRVTARGPRPTGTQLAAGALAVAAVLGVTTAAVGLPARAAHPAARHVTAVAPQVTAPGTTGRTTSAPAAGAAAAGTSAPVHPVAPLGPLQTPGLLVGAAHPLTGAQLGALHRLRGLRALAVLDAGPVRVVGRAAHAVGVDPTQFWAFTPRETARSDGLWQSVARGELAPTYGLARAGKLPLGGTIGVQGAGAQQASAVQGRIGAVAVYGVPGIDLVVDRAVGRSLGLPAGTGVLVAAPARDITDLQREVRAAVGGAAAVTVMRLAVVTAYKGGPASATQAGKPRNYRELYMASAHSCPGLSWKVLAAIGQVESDHGRNAGPSSAGALGPMQFLPSTWAFSGVDGDGDGKKDITNPFDAVPAAALYLCRDGAGRGGQALYDAVFSYNHADWYVRLVLGLAQQYH